MISTDMHNKRGIISPFVLYDTSVITCFPLPSFIIFLLDYLLFVQEVNILSLVLSLSNHLSHLTNEYEKSKYNLFVSFFVSIKQIQLIHKKHFFTNINFTLRCLTDIKNQVSK